MAVTPTATSSGTQTATVTTEHTLLDVSAAGVYTLHVDLNNMAANDVVELRVYQIVLTAGTRRELDEYTRIFYGVQARPGYVSDPIANELTDSGSLRFTLKQTFGTGRQFPWKLLAY